MEAAPSRLVLVLSNLPHSRKESRKGAFHSAGKVRTAASCTFLGPRPEGKKAEEKESLQQHFEQLRNHPLLSRLFKDNVHIQRLSTPGSLKSRLPLHLKQASVSWVSSKKRALLTSFYTTSESLSSLLDSDLPSMPTQEVEKTTQTVQPSVPQTPLNAVGVRINRSAGGQRKAAVSRNEVSTDRVKKEKLVAKKAAVRVYPCKPQDKVPLKEACRYREWASRARTQLLNDFNRLLRRSNGIALSTMSAPAQFTYYLGKGNNHQLVKACFKHRQWFRVNEEAGINAANIVWTQGKMKRLFQSLDRCESPTFTPKKNKAVSVRCSVKVYTKNSLDNRGKAVDVRSLGYELITKTKSFAVMEENWDIEPKSLRTHNKLEYNHHLTNKKSLFASIKTYCELIDCDPFSLIPVTFHIKSGCLDPEFQHFLGYYQSLLSKSECKSRSVWIVKPGENTNRGTGITVCNSLESIKSVISAAGPNRTFVIQKYIETPFLIDKRKFDIRCFALVTAINGVIQCYFYQEGYLRTSCKEFTLRDVSNPFVHLTNDAVQKWSEDYGKFEAGNKMSYSDFQRYLDAEGVKVNFGKEILPQIKAAVKASLMATFAKLNSGNCAFAFEVLGYDFLLDANMKIWLIEVNTNPCLELSSPLLARVIPTMLENAFQIAVDPYFPESANCCRRPATSLTGAIISENRFELLFSSAVDGAALKQDLGFKFYRLEVTSDDIDDPDRYSQADSDTGC